MNLLLVFGTMTWPQGHPLGPDRRSRGWGDQTMNGQSHTWFYADSTDLV